MYPPVTTLLSLARLISQNFSALSLSLTYWLYSISYLRVQHSAQIQAQALPWLIMIIIVVVIRPQKNEDCCGNIVSNVAHPWQDVAILLRIWRLSETFFVSRTQTLHMWQSSSSPSPSPSAAAAASAPAPASAPSPSQPWDGVRSKCVHFLCKVMVWFVTNTHDPSYQ